ncbi:MAG: diacylglycerol kinase family lipid kinase [Armatimonadota bacterium]|nr:MAG: diacylglycerol kinase family lipid kinase [Armatimonadota bacterium]
MRASLVVNPRAGRNRGAVAASRARTEFQRAGWEVATAVTLCAGDAERLARQAAAQSFDAVLACGGDGTLSQALAGLLDTGIPAGLIPCGTGNDFARTIGLSRNPAVAARQLIPGRTADVDLLEINDGLLWSVNIMGVGFDAQVTLRMNHHGPLVAGPVGYLFAVAQELIAYRSTPVRLTVDGETWEGEALLLAVANARSYGAGMKIAPKAEIADGLLDVVLVQHVSRVAFLRNLPRVFRGTHLTHPAVRTWRGREVTIETFEQSRHVLVDGDVQCETPVHVRVSQHRAKLLWPSPLRGR